MGSRENLTSVGSIKIYENKLKHLQLPSSETFHSLLGDILLPCVSSLN